MTKIELIEQLKDFSDDIEVRMGIRKDTGTWNIDNVGKFMGDSFITIEPGCYFYDE